MDGNEARDLAIKRLREKRDFRTHFVVYVVVNVFLWVLWALTDSTKTGVPWPVWPTLGWGLGVAINAWTVFGSRTITEDDIQKEMERSRGAVDVDRDRRPGSA